MIAKEIIVDVRTGNKTSREFEFLPFLPPIADKGIDLQKLKAILIAKNIITSVSEIE